MILTTSSGSRARQRYLTGSRLAHGSSAPSRRKSARRKRHSKRLEKLAISSSKALGNPTKSQKDLKVERHVSWEASVPGALLESFWRSTFLEKTLERFCASCGLEEG